MSVENKNQLDATEWFIALIISTCFGHFYAHHQELATICVLLPPMVHFYAHHQELATIYVLLPPMVCNALVAGGRKSGAGQQAGRPG